MKKACEVKKSTTQTKSTIHRAEKQHHNKSRYGLSARTSIHGGNFLWYDVG